MSGVLLVKEEELFEHRDGGVGAPVHEPLYPFLLEILFREGL